MMLYSQLHKLFLPVSRSRLMRLCATMSLACTCHQSLRLHCRYLFSPPRWLCRSATSIPFEKNVPNTISQPPKCCGSRSTGSTFPIFANASPNKPSAKPAAPPRPTPAPNATFPTGFSTRITKAVEPRVKGTAMCKNNNNNKHNSNNKHRYNNSNNNNTGSGVNNTNSSSRNGNYTECQRACSLYQRATTCLWIYGVAPQHDYNNIIKGVTYRNFRDEPDYTTRSILWTVNDELLFSTPVYTSVTMVPVNDAPVLRLSAYSANFNTTFVETQSPVPITQYSEIVLDVDNLFMSHVVVTLLNGVDGLYEGIYLNTDSPTNTSFSAPTIYDTLYLQQRGPIPGQAHYPLNHQFTFIANKTKAEYSAILSSLVYVNTHHNLTSSIVRNISFQIFDEAGLTSSIVYTSVTLIAVNDPPLVNFTTAVNHLSFLEDAPPYTFTVLGDYFDAEERPESSLAWLPASYVVLVRQAEYGVASIGVDGSVTFAPLLWDYGNRSFVYKVCDAQGLCSLDFQVNITIIRVNHAPMAAGPLYYTIEEDTVNQINLDQFVFDVEDYQREPFKTAIDGSSLLSIYLPEDQPSTVGMMSVSLRGHVLVFTPMMYYVGNSSVQFVVCDSEGNCTTFYLIINIQHVNHPPQVASGMRLVSLSNKNVSVFFQLFDVEDSACPVNHVLFDHCTPLNVSLVVQPANGNLTLIPPTTNPFGPVELLYVPRRDFVGNDTAVIRTCDYEGACVNTILDIETLFVLYAPYATVRDLTVYRDTLLRLDLMTILHDGARLLTPATVDIVVPPMFGNYTYNHSNGIFTYLPNMYYYGRDNFTLQACNGEASCTNATIDINVLFKNYAPIVHFVQVSVWADELASFNVSSTSSDVDDGTWPRLTFSIALNATKGVASFDPSSGNMTYRPFAFVWGNDTFLYQVCDQLGNCTLGQVNVSILPVNHPPMLSTAFRSMGSYIVEEDTSNLVLLYTLHTDPDLPPITTLADTDGPPDLLVTLLNQTRYGTLTVYSQYGVVAYLPNSNFVGDDAFVYRVCDRCSDFRNTELGRIGSSMDAACVRERSRQSQRFARGCLNVTVPLRVVNTNDPVVPAPLARIATTPTVYFDAVAYAYDEDDTQRDVILSQGKNPADYRLRLTTDIDAASLMVTPATMGTSSLGVGPGAIRTEIVYTKPIDNATGYDAFSYYLCDFHQACVEVPVTILNPSVAPRVVNLTSHGSCSSDGSYALVNQMNLNCSGLQSTDMQYGPYDWLTVDFDLPTNMAPVRGAFITFPGREVVKILDFSKAIVRNASNTDAFFGYWTSPTQLIVRVIDPGYPQPKLSTLTVSTLNRSNYFCEQFNRSSIVARATTEFDRRYCLMDAASTSLQTISTSGTPQGDWGIRLPSISGINVQRPANVDASYFGVGSTLQIASSPPLSADQLLDVCSGGASSIFDLSMFGEGVSTALTCFTQMPDGSLSAVDFTEEEKRCLFSYEELSSLEQAACDVNMAEGNPTARRRRRSVSNAPTSTVFSIQFLNISNSPLMGASLANLLNAVVNSFNVAALASVISPSSASTLLNYLAQNPPPVLNVSSVYSLGSLSETPLIYQVTGAVSGANNLLIFEFSQDTNLPSSSLIDYSITQSDLDLLIQFAPSLGSVYSGRWLSRKRLQVTIPIQTKNPAITAPQNVSFAFTLGELQGGVISNDPCRASSICGMTSQSWGLCNRAGTSCRVYGSYNGTGISGSWLATGASQAVASSNSNLLYLLFLLIGGIAILFFANRLYKRYKGRQQMKEISRLTRTWRSKFKDDKKDLPFGDSAEVWTRPPGMVSMRNNADPFSTLTDAPSPTQTANLPAPLPPMFAPRANPTIAASPGDVESAPLPPLKGAKLSNFMASPPQTQRIPTLGSMNAPMLNQPFPRRPSRDLFGSPPPAVLPPTTLRRNPSDGSRPTLPAGSALAPLPRATSIRTDLFGAGPAGAGLGSGAVAGGASMPPARALPPLDAVARDPFARPALGAIAAMGATGAAAAPTMRRLPSTFGQMQMPQRPSRTNSLGTSAAPPEAK
eukprot:m.116360 g.116360  ORF g.116360 m.116360 type:complete len:2029 (+) comp14465_c2_seq1:442-6528(+)